MKKSAIIFILAFILNFIWENLHSNLYIHYMNGEITQTILLRAILVDALIITTFSLPFLYFDSLKQKGILIIPVCLIIAFVIERWALATQRWNYAELMPIVPILNVGLTPFIQLAITGYVAYMIANRWLY